MITPANTLDALFCHLQTLSDEIAPDEQVRIYVCGFFGRLQVMRVTAHDDLYLCILVKSPQKQQIIALPEQCAFVFSVEPVVAESPAEARPEIGFGAAKR